MLKYLFVLEGLRGSSAGTRMLGGGLITSNELP